MNKRSKKRRQSTRRKEFTKSTNDSLKGTIVLQYYKRPFNLLHEAEAIRNLYTKPFHIIRDRFWKHVIPRKYEPWEARGLLSSYLSVIEREMAIIIRQCSIAYWLYLYRRIAPILGPGQDSRPVTVLIVRSIMEAAFQKFGQFTLCNRIAFSKDVDIKSILGGLLLSSDFELERKLIEHHNQLVLTEFTQNELLELYELERLSYEIWATAVYSEAFRPAIPKHPGHLFRLIAAGHSDPTRPPFRP